MTSLQPQQCATHPEVETYLRCNECGAPICPRCLVQTPVGAKCRTCARLRPHPLYETSPRHLLRGAGAALGSGLGLGLLWGALQAAIPFLGFGFITWLAYVGLGYLVGEATSVAANRKRGRALQYLAVVGVVVAFAASLSVRLGPRLWLVFLPLGGNLVGAIIFWAVLVVACLIASSRLR